MGPNPPIAVDRHGGNDERDNFVAVGRSPGNRAMCCGMFTRAIVLGSVAISAAGCGDSNTVSPVEAPGAPTSAKTKVLEAGAAIVQGKAPVEGLNVYLDGFHFASGDMKAQAEAHHFCSVLNEEVFQCVIYDGNGDDAKIMGVEYVISRRLFEALPVEEKKLWHSHVHEVKSGQLMAPGLPGPAERWLMEKLVGTYGKTWHTWHTERADTLPLGPPVLMMGFIADGQADPDMVDERDQRFRSSSRAKREERASIPAPRVAPGADAWKDGEALQLQLLSVAPGAVSHGK